MAVAVAEVPVRQGYRIKWMQGQKYFYDKVSMHCLSEHVPKQNFYCRLGELLDWEFLREQTRPVYSHTGQPSLDPVVFFKLVLVGRLENIVSARRLIEQCVLRLHILYFLGYEVDEDLPWHSTISRTRQLYPAAVLGYLFNQVFAQCEAAGLVAAQVVDPAPVKAAASLDSLHEKSTTAAPALAVLEGPLMQASVARTAPTSCAARPRDGPNNKPRRVSQASITPKRSC